MDQNQTIQFLKSMLVAAICKAEAIPEDHAAKRIDLAIEDESARSVGKVRVRDLQEGQIAIADNTLGELFQTFAVRDGVIWVMRRGEKPFTRQVADDNDPTARKIRDSFCTPIGYLGDKKVAEPEIIKVEELSPGQQGILLNGATKILINDIDRYIVRRDKETGFCYRRQSNAEWMKLSNEFLPCYVVVTP